MTIDWPFSEKITYLFSAIGARLRLIYDLRSARRALLSFELRRAFARVINACLGPKIAPVLYDGPIEIATRFEVLEVRPGTRDAAHASPATARVEQLHLQDLVRRRADSGPVDVVDVGAHIGEVAVRVAARNRGDVRVWACEPVPQNVSMLERNLIRNDLHSVTVLPLALSDHDGELRLPVHLTSELSHSATESTRVRARRGDGVLPDLRLDSARVFKINVADQGVAILRGLREVLGHGTSTDLCVAEGADAAELYDELHAQGFVRVRKHSPRASWWTRGGDCLVTPLGTRTEPGPRSGSRNL